MDAAPSTPSPTGTPASMRSRVRAMPAPSRALLDGQCATPVPVAANRATAASSRCTACAIQTSSPSQPSESTYSVGVAPNLAWQNDSSSSVSARWVCSRTPCRRASAAASVISFPVTENGEHGATATRSIESYAGSWNLVIAASVAASTVSRSSTTESGGRPPWLAPEVHRAAGRVEPQADRGRRADLGSQQVAAARREHVVVVGARRAAGAREPPQRRGRRGPHDLLVDAGPHRVQRGEPLEQRGVDSEPAGGPLVEVLVGVDEAGGQQAAGAVEHAVGSPAYVIGRGTGPDRRDPVAVDDDVPGRVLGAGGVDGADRDRVDDEGHPRPRSAASRTASRIFS